MTAPGALLTREEIADLIQYDDYEAALKTADVILALLQPAWDKLEESNLMWFDEAKKAYATCDALRADLARAQQSLADHLDVCADSITGGELRKKLAKKDADLHACVEALRNMEPHGGRAPLNCRACAALARPGVKEIQDGPTPQTS